MISSSPRTGEGSPSGILLNRTPHKQSSTPKQPSVLPPSTMPFSPHWHHLWTLLPGRTKALFCTHPKPFSALSSLSLHQEGAFSTRQYCQQSVQLGSDVLCSGFQVVRLTNISTDDDICSNSACEDCEMPHGHNNRVRHRSSLMDFPLSATIKWQRPCKVQQCTHTLTMENYR